MMLRMVAGVQYERHHPEVPKPQNPNNSSLFLVPLSIVLVTVEPHK